MLHWHGNGAAAAPPPSPQCSFSFNLFSSVSGKPAAEESGASSCSSSSSVDCTLSLGTPYTRNNLSACSSSSPASVSNSLCWDILPQQATENAVDGLTPPVGGSSAINLINGDPFLLARRCANCDTTSTPLWRNGPRGPKSLCNACGIRYKKEERRAAASSAAACEGISYGTYTRAVKGSPASSLYSGDAEEQRELYLPWRLNVVGDRPAGIYQYQ